MVNLTEYKNSLSKVGSNFLKVQTEEPGQLVITSILIEPLKIAQYTEIEL